MSRENDVMQLTTCCSFDVRGQGSEVGRHWNDGSLGARARFEEKAKPWPLLWIEDLRDEDEGIYRCRVDFKAAPTQNFQINLQVADRGSSNTERQRRPDSDGVHKSG